LGYFAFLIPVVFVGGEGAAMLSAGWPLSRAVLVAAVAGLWLSVWVVVRHPETASWLRSQLSGPNGYEQRRTHLP
jgi:hypothetical protein